MRDPETSAPETFGADAPEWARAPGFQVRVSVNPKTYRCPGCDHEVRGGRQHLVVMPADALGERRHWHTECWRSHLRRL